MPPPLPRKRSSPEPAAKRTLNGPRQAKRKSLFDAVEAHNTVSHGTARRDFLEQLESTNSESSSLSEAESLNEKTPHHESRTQEETSRNTGRTSHIDGRDGRNDSSSEDVAEEDEEEDQHEWDGFLAEHDDAGVSKLIIQGNNDEHMQITVDEVREVRRSEIKTANGKKGPSKVDRQVRNSTHQLHVMSLMCHNHIRNQWMNDAKLQGVLVKQLPETCRDEIERWRSACGDEFETHANTPNASKSTGDLENVSAAKNKMKGKGRRSKAHQPSKPIRDWGPDAGSDDEADSYSRADPTLRMLKTLCAFWRKRFTRTAPGLRKQGYKDMERVQSELKAYRDRGVTSEEFGERIDGLRDLIQHAKKAEGSRDLGAQLFTCLLRALGLNARMVASLQTAGFGWSKGEDADPANAKGTESRRLPSTSPNSRKPLRKNVARPKLAPPTERNPSKTQPKRQTKGSASGRKEAPINLSDDEDDSPLSEPPSSDSETSVLSVAPIRAPAQSHKRYDGDLKYPYYWTEVLSPVTKTYIPIDPICLSVVALRLDSHVVFEPQGGGAARNKQVMAYVVAFNPDGSAKDVTTRYLKRHVWPGKTKGVRYPVEKVPVYNANGKIMRHATYDWFKDVMSLYQPHGGLHSDADELEGSRELKPVHVNHSKSDKPPQESLQYYKNSAEFVLQRHLRREEALIPDAESLKTFSVGKGDKAVDEPVFKRSDVVTCKSSESWHKEGRQVKIGEQPLKRVPMRAVTALRKAEVEQTERETGVKAQQALFAKSQTEWIIPSPIEDGVVPKNAYGNIDVYVPTMVPEGATHVPLRGTAKICKKLNIDFAEACTGFEFGNKIAVPVLTGVVVAAQNKRLLIDAWKEEERIRKEKERKKQEKLALSMWRKMLAGLRVVERVRAEYGIVDERKLHQEMDAEGKSKKSIHGRAKKGKNTTNAIDLSEDEKPVQEMPPRLPETANDLGGGFLPEGMDVEIFDAKPHGGQQVESGGGFVVEEDGRAVPSDKADASSYGKKPAKSLREQAAQAAADDDTERSSLQAEGDEGEVNGIEWTASQEGVMQAKPTIVSEKRRRSINAKTQPEAVHSVPRKRGRPKKRAATPLLEDEQIQESPVTGSDKDSYTYEEPSKKKRKKHSAASAVQDVKSDGRRRSGRHR